MKKFKNLYKKLMEDYTEGGSVFNGFMGYPARSADNDFGVFRIDHGDSISRINAFIHRFLIGSYIDPNAAIKELRSRLNHTGIDFSFDGNRVKLNPGINRFPIKYYGDVFGQTPTTDLSKGFDHGENLPKGVLEIQCSYDQDSCMWTMKGKIKLGSSESPLNEKYKPSKIKVVNKKKLDESMMGKIVGAVKKGAEIAGKAQEAMGELQGMMPQMPGMPGSGSATENSGGGGGSATENSAAQAAAAVEKGKKGKGGKGEEKEKFDMQKSIETISDTSKKILDIVDKPETQSAAQIRANQVTEELILTESLIGRKKTKLSKPRVKPTDEDRKDRNKSSSIHKLAKKLKEAYSKKKKNKKMCEYGCGDVGDTSSGPMSSTPPTDETVVGDPMRFKQIAMYEGKLDKFTNKSKKTSGKKDNARAIMHLINRKGEIRDRVLMPIFNHLMQKKNKGKLNLQTIQRELYYVVNSAMRKAKTTLSKAEKDRVVNDLVRNFSKYSRLQKKRKIQPVRK
jgi:hypothetical protein